MKKFLMFLFAIFICAVAFAHTINWHVDDQIISTTTCSSGDSIIPPTAPVKYGYHLKEWSSRYIQLEYIESTGTQYIDTGIVPDENTEIEIKIGKTTSLESGDNGIFGNGNFGARWATVDGLRCGFGTSAWQTTNISQESQNVIVFGKNNFKYNSIALSVGEGDSFMNLTMCLFAHKTDRGTHPSKTIMYYFKIYSNNDTLVREFVPAKRNSDNAIGMYDTVTGTFFENSGTGEFIAGPVVGGL